MAGRLQFDFTFSNSQQDPPARQTSNRAMRILLMGDFSGRGNRGLHDSGDKLAEHTIVNVDIDNFNDRLARFAPQLHLPIGDQPESGMSIQFAQLDDFHPDELYQNLILFQELKDLRNRLMDPETFPQAASELRHEALAPEQPAKPISEATSDAKSASVEDDSSTFARLLEGQISENVKTSTHLPHNMPESLIQQYARDIVRPYTIPKADPFQPQYVAAVDEAISEQMRSVLHHPDFQSLEALWRSVYRLITSIETDQDLKLYLLDITKDELAEDISATQGHLEESELYRMLVEKSAGTLGGDPWSLLVGDYTFTSEADNLTLLASLGAIGSQAGSPFLAAADASLLGCRSVVETPDPRDWKLKDAETEQAWQKLRNSSVAPWIGLAHPRILLRMPYGKDSDPLDYFEFEELRHQREHKSYLWGNPAFACVMLIAMAFQIKGWSMEPGDYLDVENLPAHIFEEDGESQMMACAEEFLTERAASAMLERGLMPMMSYRNRDAARLMRFQSIAEPLKALAGPWE